MKVISCVLVVLAALQAVSAGYSKPKYYTPEHKPKVIVCIPKAKAYLYDPSKYCYCAEPAKAYYGKCYETKCTEYKKHDDDEHEYKGYSKYGRKLAGKYSEDEEEDEHEKEYPKVFKKLYKYVKHYDPKPVCHKVKVDPECKYKCSEGEYSYKYKKCVVYKKECPEGFEEEDHKCVKEVKYEKPVYVVHKEDGYKPHKYEESYGLFEYVGKVVKKVLKYKKYTKKHEEEEEEEEEEYPYCDELKY